MNIRPIGFTWEQLCHYMTFKQAAVALYGRIKSARLREVTAYLLMKNAKHFERFFGVHITPVHYYSAVPEIHGLEPADFEKVYDCTGIDWNVEGQLRYCHKVFPQYAEEYAQLRENSYDWFILYAMVREKKPRMMVEIGAGGSTRVSLAALEQNRREGYEYHLYSVDPNPQAFVREFPQDRHSLLERKVQDVDLEKLRNADLLFIDSSHVCKIGSDVNFEILELVPKLKVGAFVQWHDITIPNNYGEDWVKAGLFFNESYVVHAFLLFNSAFKVIWASRYMRVEHPHEIAGLFTHLASPEPAHLNVSLWVERVA